MTRLSILSPGFHPANALAVLYPLLRWARPVAARGLEVGIVANPEEAAHAADADMLFLDGKLLGRIWRARGQAGGLNWLETLARRVPVAYLDTQDSTGSLQPQVLPFVRRYFKNQLLRDRTGYGALVWRPALHGFLSPERRRRRCGGTDR